MNRILLCALLLLSLTACAMNAEAGAGSEGEVARTVFEAGERFSGHEVLDQGGNAVELSEIASGRLVFYLSATCGDCIKEYGGYSLLSALYPPESGRLAFLWQTEYPEEPYGLTGANAYLVPASLRLGDWVPTYFRVDASGVISHKSILLGESFAAFAGAESPEKNAADLAAYLGAEGGPLLLAASPGQLGEAEALLEKGGEGCRVIASGPADEDGAEEEDGWFDERDSAGILAALSGAKELPALLSVSGGELVVTTA